MRRRQAAQYLREQHGVPASENGLAKAAVRGDGPPFSYYNRYPLYWPDDLDTHVESKMSPKVHSTSGLPPRDGVRRGRPRKTGAESSKERELT